MYNIFTVDMPPAAAPLRYHASLPIGVSVCLSLYVHIYPYRSFSLYMYIYPSIHLVYII